MAVTKDLGKVVLTPKGNYSASIEYERYDIVLYDGSAFIALKNVIGVTPTDDGVNYMLLVQRGLRGLQGTSATVTVGTVTTGEPNTDAEVTNVGTENDAILNFKIPQGAGGNVSSVDGVAGVNGNVQITSAYQVTIPVSAWNTSTLETSAITVVGLKANAHQLVVASPESFNDYGNSMVRAIEVDDDEIRFGCFVLPTVSIVANILQII